MKRILKISLWSLLAVLLLAAAGGVWFWQQRLPQRSGQLPVAGLQAPVTVRYDELGVPHLQASHEADLYRALGYVHAQDRLFQMEMLRRLSRGELAEVLGPKLLPTDRLFRTLGIRAHADAYAAKLDPARPSTLALQAYLDGVNQFQDSHPAPLEFALLGIPKRPFTPADTLSIAGYLAYSFAAAFKSEPVLSRIRDELGPEYLRVFDLAWHPEGVLARAPADAALLQQFASLQHDALSGLGLPQFEGSNAWAISGARTASGQPLLAGDPHISFATPAVWYEAHLQAPGFELYGHFLALNPMALLGHNQRFGWSLTMFQNDDVDLIAETTDAAHPDQVLVKGAWVPLQVREETIRVKGEAPVTLRLRRSPHGPIVNEALDKAQPDARPIAMWWAFLETENPVLDAFYQLNRADTLGKARQAASGIHSPGLNVVWASAAGDIGWWAAARLPLRPPGVNPALLLDGRSPEADKLGFLPFARNPQEENPARGFIVSANHQPVGPEPVPGYYAAPDRARRLQEQLAAKAAGWTTEDARQLQADSQTEFAHRLLAPLLPALQQALTDPAERALLDQLARWSGEHRLDAVEPTLLYQFAYELARAAFADELGEAGFSALRRVRALDDALPRLAADPASRWWDRKDTPGRRETRADIALQAWQATLAHLRSTLGQDPAGWTWDRAHTVTHSHPLGQQKPLDKLFNVGPYPAPGGREVPNNLAFPWGPAPWAVVYGPSTRRVIDFAHPEQALGSNPVGQSGVWGDAHYRDQAAAWLRNEAAPRHLAEADVAAHARSTLTLQPR